MTRHHIQSNKYFERAARHIPGGVHSNVRLDGPPIFFRRGEGAWLWDVDGNDYVDYLLGQGPAFLGHASRPILEAVERACRNGLTYGAQHPLEVEASELICETLGWADMVRFGSSGTEMVQAALRLARATTGRRRFLRFEGHYHGWLDNVLLSMERGTPGPASDGQNPAALEESIVLSWNDLEAVATALESHEVAAVLMEPMMVNAGAILPQPGYLEGVRELCHQHGTVLVFDEIITGFRLALGGAAERFGVEPDLATYGKALGGGWPVAALAGRAELMEAFGTGQVNHSGTFNGNVMACAAVTASLKLLAQDPPYERIQATGGSLMEGLTKLGQEVGIPLRIQGLPAAFHASFGQDVEVTDYRSLGALDEARYRKLVEALLDEGVWVAARGIWYLSVAHGTRELEVTLERAEKAMQRL